MSLAFLYIMMPYYDIHTHKIALPDDVVSIYNLTYQNVREGMAGKRLGPYFSVGVHPWHSDNPQMNLSLLEKMLRNEKIVALGEAGLDKACKVPVEKQKEIFERQIDLAVKYNLPIIIHCVKAWDELIAIRRAVKHEKPWIIHGFRGGGDQLKQLSKFNFLFSFGEHYNREALLSASTDRILIETDESDMSIKDIYKNIASVLEWNITELKEIIAQNVSKYFDI